MTVLRGIWRDRPLLAAIATGATLGAIFTLYILPPLLGG